MHPFLYSECFLENIANFCTLGKKFIPIFVQYVVTLLSDIGPFVEVYTCIYICIYIFQFRIAIACGGG